MFKQLLKDLKKVFGISKAIENKPTNRRTIAIMGDNGVPLLEITENVILFHKHPDGHITHIIQGASTELMLFAARSTDIIANQSIHNEIYGKENKHE